MDPLRSPLLPDRPLPSIPEAEIESSTASPSSPTQPQSLPSDINDGSTNQRRAKEARRGKKTRVTWGGMPTQKHHKNLKRSTELNPPRQPPQEAQQLSRQLAYPEPLMSYNLCQEGYGLHETIHYQPQVSEVGSIQNSTFVESGEHIIDGRVDVNSFVSIDPPYGSDGMSTTEELERCRKTVLKPYLTFLKVIGWRRWRGDRQDLAPPLSVRILNTLYPSLIFILTVIACGTQVLTCFFRDEERYFDRNIHGALIVSCSDHVVTHTIVGDLLLLAAFLWGVYIFRYGEPEHLAVLMQTVYLSFNFRHRVRPERKTTIILRFILFLGVAWVFLSLIGSILRVLSLELLDKDAFIEWITVQDTANATEHLPIEHALRYSLVIYSILGFVLFDLLYVAVVITYTSEAQLLLTYTSNIIDKVQTKSYSLGEAIKDMGKMYGFLQVLNGQLGRLTSLCLFIFITTAISSLMGVTGVSEEENMVGLAVAVGIVNLIQWSLLTLAPLVQAARLTAYCRKLRRVGLEIGSRPFSYLDTPQLVLDSFLQYTSATLYTAKLAGIPIYPSYVIGFFFFLGILATWAVATFNLFKFAPWF